MLVLSNRNERTLQDDASNLGQDLVVILVLASRELTSKITAWNMGRRLSQIGVMSKSVRATRRNVGKFPAQGSME